MPIRCAWSTPREKEHAGRTTSHGEYLRDHYRRNAQKAVVFFEDRYGIYFLSELALLFGRRVKRPQVGAAATVDALFERLRSAQNGP